MWICCDQVTYVPLMARSSSAELLWTTSLQLCDQPFHGLVKHRPSSTLVPSPAASPFCKMWLQPLSCCWGEMLDLLSRDTWHASVVQGCGGPLSRTSSHLSPSPSLFQPASVISFPPGWQFPQQHPPHLGTQAAPMLSHFHHFRKSLLLVAV